MEAIKEVLVLPSGGTCWGVDEAVRSVLALAKNAGGEKAPEVLGRLVHNQNAIGKLTKAGVRTILKPEEAKGRDIVITAHGRDPKDIAKLRQSGFNVIDETCPIVQAQHRAALVLMQEQGRQMVLVATRKPHPEVEGTIGVLNDRVQVIEFEDQIDLLRLDPEKPVGVVAQTTYDPKAVARVVIALKNKYRDVAYSPTVCDDISIKIADILKHAEWSDTIIVISDAGSSNGNHLRETAESTGRKVIFILDQESLDREMLSESNRVILTAAASTFEEDIQGVTEKLTEWGWTQKELQGPQHTKAERARISAEQAAGRHATS